MRKTYLYIYIYMYIYTYIYIYIYIYVYNARDSGGVAPVQHSSLVPCQLPERRDLKQQVIIQEGRGEGNNDDAS